MPTVNQSPEQLASDKNDQLLLASGWVVQETSSVNLGAAVGEYDTAIVPADYIHFVNKVPVGVN